VAVTPFATNISKQRKQQGRARQAGTPVAVRSRVALPDGTEDWIRAQLGRKLDHASTLIERGTVRFDDVNGPRGGIDIMCRIKLVVSGRPSVIAEERAVDARTAFGRALPKLAQALRKLRDKHGLRGTSRSTGPSARASKRDSDDSGELIGRRTGRGSAALDRALDRPEKRRRDAYADTASPSTSASDRRAGGKFTARRNARARTSRATATLEDSRTRPSRKSTRRSANRGKASQGKERTAVSRSLTPSARASRRR
jgi:ribosome-associated translation inhibitor RaiA